MKFDSGAQHNVRGADKFVRPDASLLQRYNYSFLDLHQRAAPPRRRARSRARACTLTAARARCRHAKPLSARKRRSRCTEKPRHYPKEIVDNDFVLNFLEPQLTSGVYLGMPLILRTARELNAVATCSSNNDCSPQATNMPREAPVSPGLST